MISFLQRMNASIQFKFAVAFMGVLMLSCLFSFFLILPYSYNYTKQNIGVQLVDTSTAIIDASERLDLTAEEIVSLYPRDTLSYLVNDEISDFKFIFTANQISLIESGEIVCKNVSGVKDNPAAIFKINDSYVCISINNNYNQIAMTRFIVSACMLICAFIGSVFVSIAVLMITRPVKKITRAAQQVAKGNFDVEVKCSSNDEIGNLAETFNNMTHDLKNMEIFRKDFISNVSHEFKTPIASIQGFAMMLKNKNLSEEKFEDYTNIIIEETNRLSNLSSNMLRLSHLENKKLPEKEAIFRLDEQIRKTILLLETSWSEKDIELDIELQNISFEGYEELIQQVWINLIQNAIKFSDKGGKISINLEQIKRDAVVTIKDYGVGIDKEKQSRVFEQFYQADSSHKSMGNGLGLAIVKKIVELSKGSITLNSEKGKGTEFIIKLPIK